MGAHLPTQDQGYVHTGFYHGQAELLLLSLL